MVPLKSKLLCVVHPVVMQGPEDTLDPNEILGLVPYGQVVFSHEGAMHVLREVSHMRSEATSKAEPYSRHSLAHCRVHHRPGIVVVHLAKMFPG